MTAPTITLSEMKNLLQSGRALHIVDVRTPAEFARIHAKGAQLVPLDSLDSVAPALAATKEPLYVICHSGTRAAKACQRLAEAGIGQALCVEGGTAAWEKAGLPVERSPGGSISLERQVRIAAGSLVLTGLLLALIHPTFLGLSAFMGAGLVFAGITDYCGIALLLAKMPWNRHRDISSCAAP